MKFIFGYAFMWAVTFLGLSTYWVRVKRPHDWDTGKEWSEGEIAFFGLLQGLVWPLFIPVYVTGMLGYFTFRAAKSWVEVVAPAQHLVVNLPPAPKKDPYLMRGERELERFLARESNLYIGDGDGEIVGDSRQTNASVQ